MASRRTDRLVGAVWGAVVTLFVLVLAAGVLLWLASEPAQRSAPPRPQGSPEQPGGAVAAPTDLGPEDSWFGQARLDAAEVVLPGSRLQDVRAVGTGVRSGPGGTTAQVLVVEALVPFEVVAAEVGEGAVVSAADGGRATVAGPVQLLGRQWEVTATGTVDVVGGRLVLVPTDVEVDGLGELSRGLAAVARQAVRIEQQVEGLPEGLVLRDVAVVPDGFRADLTGEDVVLVP